MDCNLLLGERRLLWSCKLCREIATMQFICILTRARVALLSHVAARVTHGLGNNVRFAKLDVGRIVS